MQVVNGMLVQFTSCVPSPHRINSLQGGLQNTEYRRGLQVKVKLLVIQSNIIIVLNDNKNRYPEYYSIF